MTFYPPENFFHSFSSSSTLVVFVWASFWVLVVIIIVCLCATRVKSKMMLYPFYDHSKKKLRISSSIILLYFFLLASSLSMLDAIKTYGKCHYEYREERHEELTRTIWDIVLLFSFCGYTILLLKTVCFAFLIPSSSSSPFFLLLAQKEKSC